MTRRTISVKAVVIALGLVGWLGLPIHVQAATIVTDFTNPQNVPGIATFATTGPMMSGMEVTATFSTGFTETLSWQDLGGATGGVFGTLWSLLQTGDTFAPNSWTFNSSSDAVLARLSFDGAPGLTLFDLTFDGAFGTAGSARGRDFQSNLGLDAQIVATYSNPVGVGGAAPVGDIFHLLDVDFRQLPDGGVLPGSFTFSQDTDNDSRRPPPVPEPASLLLLGSGLAGLGLWGWKRRRDVQA